MNNIHRFTSDEVLQVLSLSPNATAIYSTRQLVIQTANDVMLGLWGRGREVIGLPLEEAVPELNGQPFIRILQNVLDTGKTYTANDSPAQLLVKGRLQLFYFDFIYRPIKNEAGQVYCILHTATDVTERYLNRQTLVAAHKTEDALSREQALNEELKVTVEELNATNEELKDTQLNLSVLNFELEERVARRTLALAESEANFRNMIMSTPISMAVLKGRDLVISVANQSMIDIWGRTQEQVIDQRLLDVFPELVDQPFPKMLNGVFETGQRVAVPEIEADIDTPAGRKHIYVDFSYDPLCNQAGEVESILVTVIDITNTVEVRKLLEKSKAEQQALNEEISTFNEELAATNEELYATNEELSDTQLNLQTIIKELETSEGRLRYMLADAPIAIALLSGPELHIEAANKKILATWGKSDEVIGLPLSRALPELAGQDFLTLLTNVFTTGEAYQGNEVRALLEQDGIIEEVYSNFVYHPIKDSRGQTTSIIVIAHVVTEQVMARRAIEKAEEKARFAIEAANVGTWFLDIDTHEFVVSARLKEQFGYLPVEEVTFDRVAHAIPEDYRDKVLHAIETAIATGDNYVMEHPIIGPHDQKKRWVRAFGKLYPDAKGKRSHFSGIIMDITEQKQDELRKNDFIGMVSHELKTPLTSLSAYSQMLYNKARNGDDAFTVSALEKVNSQVKKMSAMINGFLNVSRLESGKIFLTKEDFRLDELVEEMVSDARLAFNSHDINITYSEPVTIHADRDKIGSVISNLLSNAVKYSPRGKTIAVACSFSDQAALVSVKDEGMGVKPVDIEKIFDRYYRVESAHTQTVSGFGIGLYLCAEIVNRHKGSIRVESQKGQGSTFYFTLPLN